MKLYPNITCYFFIWLVCLIIIFTFGLTNFSAAHGFSKDLIKNLANWDGGHFLRIAQNGYQTKYLYAFFPLYPMLISLVQKITGNYLTSAILISMVSAFLSLHILYRLVSLDFGKNIAQKVIIYLLIFPTSFYLITAYSEGLFLFLTLTTFYFFRKKSFVWATVFAGLTSMVRISGIAVSAGLILAVLTTPGFNKKNWFILLSPWGLILYCIYLLKVTGDPVYFLTAESLEWRRSLAIPGFSFWEVLALLSSSGFITTQFNNFLELLFAIFGLGMVIRSFRFVQKEYAFFGLISILLPLTTSTLTSMPRFLLPIFPIFILLALVKDFRVIFLIQLLSVLLLSAFSILFINGFWVS